MTQTVFVVRVRVPEGARDYVTVLPPETVTERGLPSVAIVGALTKALGGDPAAADVFTPNPVFVRFMHDVIARHAPLLAGLRDEAARIGDGFVYVYDARTPDPAGAVPREDIIGAVKVEGGVPVADGYRANPNHQLLTSRGFFNLGEELHACLMAEVEALRSGG
ncbi:MAG TPA: hypothetical protein VFJ82_16090 [Longimicrobium sp.]|nr:hypothetical protein [Longimicrobium sp.]